jgi:uncharacterized protein YndB with AHSA1/START domain
MSIEHDTIRGRRWTAMADLHTSRSIWIDAPVDQVWKAITTPEVIKRWFFGVDTETDWRLGSALVHRGEWEGRPYEDRGTILRIEPPTLLVHDHGSEVSGLPDEPENYQEVTWSLSERDGRTRLTVAERNLPSEQAKVASERGWETALTGLKTLLEHEGARARAS